MPATLNTVQKITKNTIALAISSVANLVIGFFFTMYVARYLGVDGFGILSFALALTAIFGVLTHVGINQLAIREVARDKSLAVKYLANMTALKIILAAVTFGSIALTVKMMGYPAQTAIVIYIIALSVIADAFTLSFLSIFQAYERMEFVTLAQVLSLVVRLAGALFVITHGFGLNAFAFTYLVSSASALLCSYVVSSHKVTRLTLQFDFNFFKEALRHSWPFGLSITFYTLSMWISSVILSSLKGDEAVGLYSAAYRMETFLLFVPIAFNGAVFPVMSQFSFFSKDSMKSTLVKAVKYLTILGVPIGVGIAVLANEIILLIYGAEFERAAVVLQILMLPVIFNFSSSVFFQLFNSINRQTITMKVNGVCLLLNVALNFILISKYSYIGAGVAAATTELAALAMRFPIANRLGYGFSKMELVGICKPLLAGTLMGIFLFYFKDLALWSLIPLAALLYFAVLLVIKGLDKEDLFLFRQLLRRRQQQLTVHG